MRAGWYKAAAIFIAAAIVVTASATAWADKKADLQEKFKKRLADITELKRDGKIGETFEGWLEAVKKDTLVEKQQKLVDEENADRKELYQLIADEEKTTADLVGQRNANRNYKNGKKGEWFKLKSGDWKQKEKE